MDHVSVKGETIYRLLHTHVLYWDKDKIIFGDIEVATRGTKYASSIAL